jgi:hypothetical protein
MVRVSTFIEPCLPSRAERPPSGPGWVHEIKHDGFRMMVHRDSAGIRLITRNGHDWSDRFPLIAEAAGALKARSFLLDGKAVACDRNGLPSFDRLRYRRGTGPCSSRLRPAGTQRAGLAAGTSGGAHERSRRCWPRLARGCGSMNTWSTTTGSLFFATPASSA